MHLSPPSNNFHCCCIHSDKNPFLTPHSVLDCSVDNSFHCCCIRLDKNLLWQQLAELIRFHRLFLSVANSNFRCCYTHSDRNLLGRERGVHLSPPSNNFHCCCIHSDKNPFLTPHSVLDCSVDNSFHCCCIRLDKNLLWQRPPEPVPQPTEGLKPISTQFSPCAILL